MTLWVDGRRANRIARAVIEGYKRAHTIRSDGASTNRRRQGESPHTAQIAFGRQTTSVDVTQPNATGINRWWAFEEGPIPGVGRYLVNLAQQNLVIQSRDLQVPHRGVDIVFERTFNSYSGHDYVGSDGSTEVGQFGNGWTNTFDAHIAQNSSGGISVYDSDGARYDYAYDSYGNFAPPPGMEGNTLVSDDGAEFFWTKKSGVQYAFYAPYYEGPYAAYSGRLYRISGRNRNTYLQFSYAWDNGDSSLNGNLYQIVVTTEGGQQVTLQFANFDGRRLCAWVRYPDGNTFVSYGYDAAGNLTVTQLPSNSSDPTAYRYETYGGYGRRAVICGQPTLQPIRRR